MIRVTALLTVAMRLVPVFGHPTTALRKRDDTAIYIASMANPTLCMFWSMDTISTPTSLSCTLASCTQGTTQTWEYSPVVDQQALLYNGDKSCVLGGDHISEFMNSSCVNPQSASNSFALLQNVANSSICLNGDVSPKTFGRVSTGLCSESAPWIFGSTPTFSSLPTQVAYPVYKDTGENVRIHGLGRDDLCLTASAVPGDLVQESAIVLAPCVQDSSPMAKFSLFNAPPSSFPKSSYTGNLTFSSNGASPGTQYCLDTGDGPVMGTQLLTWGCKGGGSQTFELDNKLLKMAGTNWCATAVGPGELPGGTGDYKPMFSVVMDQCDSNRAAQHFYIGTT
ncbi:hypothetical protein M231_02831 [Tremella mesenterica]|uniref:Uncharacterized protein n=1 Tax=Tremella mesenterica TaxID=5217 RepID=A0A4V1M4C6_TREME|nr:hypothetical protein M231_02831 [Tremella mesenterica]